MGISFDSTRLDDINAIEGIVGLEYMVATMQRDVALHDGIELLDISTIESQRKAQFCQPAILARDLQFIQGNNLVLQQWDSLELKVA